MRYANTIPTVLCMSTVTMLLTFTSACRQKEVSCHASREICYNPAELYEYYLVYYMPII